MSGGHCGLAQACCVHASYCLGFKDIVPQKENQMNKRLWEIKRKLGLYSGILQRLICDEYIDIPIHVEGLHSYQYYGLLNGVSGKFRVQARGKGETHGT